MTEAPKIVYERLLAAGERTAHEHVHPVADLLAAFAEQALPVPERENILEHLALCVDCREVVALALPADLVAIAPETHREGTVGTRASAPAAKNWLSSGILAWPRLRWAAVTAGVAVVASVFLLHPGKLNQAGLPSEKQPNPATTSSVSGTEIASSSQINQPLAFDKTRDAEPKSDLQLPEDRRAPRVPPKAAETQPAIRFPGNNTGNNRRSASRGEMAVAPASGGKIEDHSGTIRASAIPANAVPASAIPGSGVNPEISMRSSELAQAPSPAGTLVARNEAPAVEKAKPAPQAIEAEVAASEEKIPSGSSRQQTKQAVDPNAMAPSPPSRLSSSAQTFLWTISDGVLRRSPDNGQSWQNALRADHLLLCYASHDGDIWAGGEAGTLYHSLDNGVTWVQLRPAVNSQTLSANVRRIAISGIAGVVLSTSSDEIWSSLDGGKTWGKK